MWKQLTIKTYLSDDSQIEQIEDFLLNEGALSTTFSDNQDDPVFEPELNTIKLWPNTNITVLFEFGTDVDAIVDSLKQELNLEQLDHIIEEIADQDWTRAWMDQFHPMKFGNKLWVCPSNQEVNERGAVIVQLDPGLAFGTGTHPTTRMCLQYLDELANNGQLKGKIVIDYGCGSGILAIAAIKLGAAVAYCVDIDPQAIESTLANAQNNGVLSKIRTYLSNEFVKESVKGDIILANILAGPLVELQPTLAAISKPNAKLVLSGILDIKEKAIKQAYSKAFYIDQSEYDEEWVRVTGTRLKHERRR